MTFRFVFLSLPNAVSLAWSPLFTIVRTILVHPLFLLLVCSYLKVSDHDEYGSEDYPEQEVFKSMIVFPRVNRKFSVLNSVLVGVQSPCQASPSDIV